MATPIKIKFTLVKRDDEVLVTRYCLNGQNQWILVREDHQTLNHHEPIANKEPTLIAIREMTRQRTITLFLSDSDAEPYTSEIFSIGSISDEDSNNEAVANEISDPSSIRDPNLSMQAMFQELMKFQMESFKTMVTSLQESLAPMSRPKNQRMEVTKFNGKQEDAKTWLISYEKACEFNGWKTDDAKVNNLKAHLDGIALKWFNSRLIEELPFEWTSWKEAFLDSFGQNRIGQAQAALAWEYRSGPLLEYYYEKQRLLQLAFPEISDNNFITMTLLGLPGELTKQLSISELHTKEELRRALTQLQPVKSKENDRLKFKQSKPMDYSKRDVNKIFSIGSTSEISKQNTFMVEINEISVLALFDTGSQVNMLSSEFVTSNNIKTTPSCSMLKSFNGQDVTCDKSTTAHLTFNCVKTELSFIVADNITYDVIIGIGALRDLKVKWDFSNNCICVIKSTTPSIYNKDDAKLHFPQLFKPSSKPPILITEFKLSPGAPIIQSKPYRLSREKFFWAQAKIKELLDKGIITASKSEYASPCVIVPKENGTLRLCQDYRDLNKSTTLDPYPFPIIDDIISMFGGCSTFSKIDLKDGFWQVGLTEDSRKYTAFVLPFGHWELTRLPFGWKNSPSYFQREMSKVLGDLLDTNRVAVYIDDICVAGDNRDECAELTGRVLHRLSQYGIQVNEEKSSFGELSIGFLGRVIDGSTKTTKTESIERVKKMKKPTDLHTLRCFTGLTGHFRSFIPNYAEIVRPLDRLKQKDQPFIWDENCEISYQKLIKMISSNPILSVPDWKLPFELSCDASYYGTGAILYQRDSQQQQNRQLRVIGYYSYTFSKPEINYSTTEKECLAVIRAIEYFRSYLEGKEFKVNSDHQALSHLLSLKEPKNRLGRWQAFLMSFSLKINHRSGRELTDADALSRLCPEISEVNAITEPHGRIAIKPDQVNDILNSYHNDPQSGGHDGISRTYHKISNRFHWPGMKEDIVKYIRTCDICQRVKAKFKPSSDLMILPKHSENMFEVIHVDYGELKKRSQGFATTRSFLVLVDEATRLCQAVAMKEDANSFTEFIRNHPFSGSIKTIISDCGKSFISKTTQKLARDLKIHLKTTSPYSPWSNGMAERHVQKIKLYCELYPDFSGGWKRAIEAAAKHNNRAYNRALGCSPYFKAFGKVDLLPADYRFEVDRLCEISEKPFSRDQQESYRKRIQEYANRNIKRTNNFSTGSMVLVLNGKQGKHFKLDGPFEILRIDEKDGVQKTIVYKKDDEERFAHVRNCRPYHPRSDVHFK